jgi:hypothetical protein
MKSRRNGRNKRKVGRGKKEREGKHHDIAARSFEKKRHWHDEMHHRGLAKASGKDETGNRWI